MHFRTATVLGCSLIACLIWTGTSARAQRSGMFQGSADDPGIKYLSAPLDNVVDRLNQRLDAGTATLTFEGSNGYLRSALEAIGLPIDSQMLVFSNARLVKPVSLPSDEDSTSTLTRNAD